MTHLHITSWLVAIILFFVIASFYKQGKEKPGKILHMITRLFYLLIIFTGYELYRISPNVGGELILKVLAGIWVIATIEMILGRTKKEKPTKGVWIQFAIAAFIAIVLGFGRLPLGIQLFG